MAVALTPEQAAVLGQARAPEPPGSAGRIIRVTAAAGTGKTTTLQAFAAKLGEHGHTRVVYLTFNKEAALDASKRLGQFATCKTIHSAAFECMGVTESGLTVIGEEQVDDIILNEFEEDFEDLLVSPTAKISGGYTENSLKRRIGYFIRKTLDRFLQSKDSLEDGLSASNRFATYYVAQLWHKGAKDDKGLSFLKSDCGDFYVSHARRLYEMLRPGGRSGKVTYDTVMKQCQLERRFVNCSALLVDESQDCTACQIDWASAHRPGRLVAFVGDAVQTIYAFRGAKSKFLMDLKDCVDHELTVSFRFGPRIAMAANAILFAKEHSAQVDWKPYRVVGGASEPGRVVAASALDRLTKRTILARTNAELLMAAINLLHEVEGDAHPSFAINGRGPNSGRGKWLSVLKQIKVFYKLFVREGVEGKLGLPGLENDDINTYDELKRVIADREMNNFAVHLGLIERYKENTLHVLETFKANVLERQVPTDQADIILSTVHAAKGMEWATVEVRDDFSDLAVFEIAQPQQFSWRASGATASVARFGFNGFGDDVNLWYVALTRARETLAVPPKFLETFTALHSIAATAATIRTDRLEANPQPRFFFRPFTTENEASQYKYGFTSRSQVFAASEVLMLNDALVTPFFREVEDQGGLVVEGWVAPPPPVITVNEARAESAAPPKRARGSAAAPSKSKPKAKSKQRAAAPKGSSGGNAPSTPSARSVQADRAKPARKRARRGQQAPSE